MPYFVQRGYIDVVAEVRGTGDSHGTFNLLDPQQGRDGAELVDWAAKLPNASGKVGLYGPSYMGIDQYMTANAVRSRSPLKALFPIVAGNDTYRDLAFHGGILNSEFDLAVILTIFGGLEEVNPLVENPTDVVDTFKVETEHAPALAQLQPRADAEHHDERRPGVRRGVLGGARAAEHARRDRAQADPRVHGRRLAGRVPARRDVQLLRLPERLRRPRRERADEAEAAGDGPLPAAPGPLVPPHRGHRPRHLPDRARLVRPLAEERAHRDRQGEAPAALCTRWAPTAGSTPPTIRSPSPRRRRSGSTAAQRGDRCPRAVAARRRRTTAA